MSLDVNLFLHRADPQIQTKLDLILAKLDGLLQQGATMATSLDALQAQVQQTTDIEQSAITLIQGLAAQIQASKTALQALADQLNAKSSELAAAVQANSPA